MLRYLLFIVFAGSISLLAGCNHANKTSSVKSVATQNVSRTIAITALDNTSINAALTLTQTFQKLASDYNLKMYKKRNGKQLNTDLYLRGYFSVLADENPKNNTILYVFDVLDGSGIRLHRIQGKYFINKEIIQTQDGFWGIVGYDGYNAIAAGTLQQLRNWLNTSKY